MSNYKDLKTDKFKDTTDIVDTGTEGTKVAVGTTAQRGSTTGQWRYNSTTGYFEGRNDGGFSALEPIPTVTSVDDGEVDSAGGGNQTIVVTGTNFSSGGTIAFIGSSAEFNATTTTYNSSTQVTAVAPKSSFLNAQEPYKVKFTSASAKTGTSASGLINVDNAPTWSTASGTVVTSAESLPIPTTQLSATDAEGDAVTYAETTSALSGIGVSLSSSGELTGTLGSVGADTTTSFDVRATAGGKTADRSFNIITKNLNENVILYDGTNTDPIGNNPSGDNDSITSNVSLTNRGNGSTGTMREAFANATVLTAHSEIYGHYNTSNTITLSSTIWSMLGDNSGHVAPYNHFGMHNGGSYGNRNIWFTLDFGGQPSFKLRRMTGYAVWGTGSADFTIWGTNDSAQLPGNSRGNFQGNSMTKILEDSLGAGGSWDTGVVSNANFHRYLSFEMHDPASGSYDWGWNTLALYGDYY
jgi:hypothetical protein